MKSDKKRAVVVGAGLSGSVMARELAEKYGYNVKVIEARSHVAGNIYDEYEEGILIQKYGPHFIATFSWDAVSYMKRFTEFYEYPVKAQSYVDGKYIERPYNFRSLQQLLGPENSSYVLKHIREAFPNWHRVTLREMMDHLDTVVSDYGKLLYNKLFVTYCAKQWGMKVEDIDPGVINRTDIVLGYETQLDDTDFQYLPADGYTSMVERMLDHENIEVVLNEDAIKEIELDEKERICLYKGEIPDILYYSGMIDELFSYRYGELPYISRYFTYERYDIDRKLPCGVITYPKEEDYIRQTECIHFNPDKRSGNYTIVQTEYPIKMDRKAEIGNEPYYPIINDENSLRHKKYKDLVAGYKNLYVGGRLGDFKYYDMDAVVLNAIKLASEICQKNG